MSVLEEKWSLFFFFFLNGKRGTPPQEEDAPVECREPRLSLQRKLLHSEGRGELLAPERVFKNTEIAGSKFLCTS